MLIRSGLFLKGEFLMKVRASVKPLCDKCKVIKRKGKVMFVGDGINDAPVIKLADVGVSMGGIGSDAAIEASDIVLIHDDLTKLKTAIEIAKITDKKVKQSIIFALIVKAHVVFPTTAFLFQ